MEYRMNRSTKIWALGALLLAAIVLFLWLRPRTDSSIPPIRVVVITPLTGPTSAIGERVTHGVQIAIAQLAKQYPSQKYDVIYLDSKNQPKEAVSALNALASAKHIDAVICCVSSVSNAIAPLCEENRIPMVATTTTFTGLPQKYSNVVRMYPTSDAFVNSVAQYAKTNYSRLAVIYVNDDFGRSNTQAFKAIYLSDDRKIVREDSFELTETNHRVMLQRILKDRPDAVFLTGYGSTYSALILQLREINPDIPLLTDVAIANPDTLIHLGLASEKAIFSVTNVELSKSSSRASQEFRELYQEQFSKEAYMVAGFARDSLVLIAHAVDGLASAKQPLVITKKMLIDSTPIEGSVGRIQLDDEGECLVELKLATRINGTTELLENAR